MPKDVYLDSVIISKLRKRKERNLPLKLAFLDLDGTMTGNPEVQKKTESRLEELGFVIIFASSRPYELMLSNASLAKSPTLTRPISKGGKDEHGKRFSIDLAELPEFNALIDPDVMAETTGVSILVKLQTGEYIKDPSYQSIPLSPDEWRNAVREIIHELTIDRETFSLREIEERQSYEEGLVDVAPPDYRIQIDFTSLDAKQAFWKELEAKKHEKNLEYLEYLDESDPEAGHYSSYLFPFGGFHLKENAVSHIFNNLVRVLESEPADFQVLLGGNGFPELPIACYAAQGSKMTSFFVGGSCPMISYLTDPEKNNYAGEDITAIKKELKQEKPGVYTFKDRKILLGDVLYPETEAITSLYAYLSDPAYHGKT